MMEFVVVCLESTGEWVEGFEVGVESMEVILVNGAGCEPTGLSEGVEEM